MRRKHAESHHDETASVFPGAANKWKDNDPPRRESPARHRLMSLIVKISFRRFPRFLLLLDEVAEVFEFDGEVDVVDHDFVGDMEDHGGEVEDAADAGVDEGVGDFLGGGGGDGDDGHADVFLANNFIDAVHRMNRNGGCFVAFAGVVVEGGDDFKAFLFEAFVGEEGKAEVADADEDDGLEAGGAEEVGDHRAELLDVVSEAAGAELAEVGEVFAELGGFDAGGLGEGFAGHGANVVGLEALEAAQIN